MSSNPRRRARPRKRLIIRPPNYAPNRTRRNPMPIGTSWTGHKANFISPKGNYGIVPSSELAMSTRIADKPVIQFALFSDKKRWPHVTWAHIMTPDGFVTDGLPSEVLPAEVRRTLGGFGNEKMPKGALQKHEYALNQLKQYAVFRYQYRDMPAPKWGAVDATGPFPRGTNWRDLLPPGVLSKPGILGISAKTKSDAIRRGMNEFALHGGKAVGKNPRASDNPRKVHQMMVRAFLDGRNAVAGSRYRTDGKTLWVWGNVVAAKQADGIMLRDAGWRTLLTKSILNELLQQMGIPGSIGQVKHIWMLGKKPWPGSVVAPYKTLPKPMNGTATNPRSGRRNPVVDGTTYKGSTPRRVIEILEANRRDRGPRLRIWYGDAKTGAAWGDTEAGHVGRSTGSSKIPLMISRRTSTGGGGILDACIIRIEYASKAHGGVLYQHPRFHIPKGKTPWIKRNPCGTRRNPLEYRTVDTRTVKGIEAEEKLQREGWSMGRVGLLSTQFYRRKCKKCGGWMKTQGKWKGVEKFECGKCGNEDRRRCEMNPRGARRNPSRLYKARWGMAGQPDIANVSFEARSDYEAKLRADKIARELGVTHTPRTITKSGGGVIECRTSGTSSNPHRDTYNVYDWKRKRPVFGRAMTLKRARHLSDTYNKTMPSRSATPRFTVVKARSLVTDRPRRSPLTRRVRSNPRSCKVCGGPLVKMGGLGNLVWYRCRNCGMESSVKK